MSNEFEESNKKHISEMTKGEKLQYFRDYYLKWVIAIAVIAAFVIYGIVTVAGPRDVDVLKVIVFDDYIDMDAAEDLEAEVRNLLDAHDDHQVVNIQDGYSSTDSNSLQSLGVLTANKDVDAIVAPADVFEAFAGDGFYLPLDEEFGQTFLDAHNDTVIRCAGYKYPETDSEDTWDYDGDGKGEVLPYGIDISGSEKWMKVSTDCEDPVIGIMADSGNPENAAKFLELLLGDS